MNEDIWDPLRKHLGEKTGNPLLKVDQRYLGLDEEMTFRSILKNEWKFRNYIQDMNVPHYRKIFYLADFVVEINRIKLVKHILNELNLTNKNRVVDIGCNTSLFYNRNWKYIGVDVDEKVLYKTIDAYKAAKLIPPNLLVCDALHLPIKDDFVDAVIFCSVIEHFTKSDGLELLSEISRILIKDGYLILSTDNRHDFRKIENFFKKLLTLTTNTQINIFEGHKLSGEYTKSEIEEALKNTEFEILKKDITCFYFWHRLATVPRFIRNINLITLLIIQICENLLMKLPGKWSLLRMMIYLVRPKESR